MLRQYFKSLEDVKDNIIDPLELFAKILWVIGYFHFWCLTWFSNYAYKTSHNNSPIRHSFIIFPINLNFPIMPRCVLKAIIHRTKTVDCFMATWGKFYFSKGHFLWYCTCLLYLINFSILSQSVPKFPYVFPSFFIYHLCIIQIYVRTCFFFKLNKKFMDKNVLLLKHRLTLYTSCHIIFT